MASRSPLLAVVANVVPSPPTNSSTAATLQPRHHCQVRRCCCSVFACALPTTAKSSGAAGVPHAAACATCGHGHMYHSTTPNPTMDAAAKVIRDAAAILALAKKEASVDPADPRQTASGPSPRAFVTSMDALSAVLEKSIYASPEQRAHARTLMERMVAAYEVATDRHRRAAPAPEPHRPAVSLQTAPAARTTGCAAPALKACDRCRELGDADMAFCHNCGLRRRAVSTQPQH